jgi:hypothetical protein
LAQTPHQFRDFATAEQEQYHECDDQNFRESELAHGGKNLTQGATKVRSADTLARPTPEDSSVTHCYSTQCAVVKKV